MNNENLKKIKLVYLASPIRAIGNQTVEGNIASAKKIALELWKRGYGVICPASNSDLPYQDAVDLKLPVEQWLNSDLRMLSMCDLVVVAPEWENSVGVKGEIEFAKNNNIQVLFWGNNFFSENGG